MAAAGPIANAGTQLLLSLVMLRMLSPTAFGSFSFLLVATQLSWGIWSALFCAPLPVLIARDDAAARASGESALITANFAAAILSLPVFFLIGTALDLPPAAAACFCAYGGIALLRWFGRAFAYVHDQPVRTMVSDVATSIVLLASLGIGLLVGIDPLPLCYGALLLSAVVGLTTFGGSYLSALVARPAPGFARRYAGIWRDQASWALMGVVTTEATANAHIYLVTALQGPAALAPIAASGLLIRPINVAQNALADFERPQMARLIRDGDHDALRRAVHLFRAVLAVVWVGTAALAILLFLTNPRLLFPAHYDVHWLETAAALWMLVAAIRMLQVPPSTLLQAVGAFRPLAFASLWSSIVAVLAVLVLLWTTNAMWALLGIAAGAAIFLYWIERSVRLWMTTERERDATA